MRTHYRAEHVKGVVHSGDPFTHSLVNGVLKCFCARFNRVHLCAEQFHTVAVQRLPFRIFLTHKDLALEAHERRSCSRGNAVLPCAGFGYNTCFAHPLCKQALTEHIVYLVRPRVVEILAFKIDLCAAEILRHILCVIQQRRSACILFQKRVELIYEIGVVFVMLIGFFKPYDLIHQRFGYILPSVNSESSFTHILPSP